MCLRVEFFLFFFFLKDNFINFSLYTSELNLRGVEVIFQYSKGRNVYTRDMKNS